MEEFIAKRSNIPIEFLREFFNLGGDSYGDTFKNIDFDNVIKWLNVGKNNLKRVLVSNFKIMEDYTDEKVLVKNKKRGANYVSKIMLTPDCFKELCMLSQTDKARGVRKYYITAEGLLRDYFEEIINSLNMELSLIKKNIKGSDEIIGGHLYIIKAQNTTQENMYKLGNSEKMKKRLRTYNTGNANDIDYLFKMKVDDIKKVEGCVKNIAKEYLYRKRKEVYNIDLDFLRKLCMECKNFIRQIDNEMKKNRKDVVKKMKKIKNKDKTNSDVYLIIDKNN